MVGRLSAMTALLLSTSMPAAASPLRPTGPWNVNYQDSQCVASRNYGTAERPLFLILRPSPLGGVMRLVIVQKGRTAVAQHPVKLWFDGKPAAAPGMLTYNDRKNGNRAASINMPMAEFKAHQAAAAIGIQGGWLNQTFIISKVPQVAAELDKCLTTLQAAWNIAIDDRAARISREARPKRSVQGYFLPGDYPWPALNAQQSGSVKLVFLVDEKGGISDCSVDETSGVPSLDTMSCYVLQERAKFEPALGPDAQPARSAYCLRVTWVTGDQAFRKPKPYSSDPRCPERS